MEAGRAGRLPETRQEMSLRKTDKKRLCLKSSGKKVAKCV